ncbi:hypothetical protein ACJRO7_025825 [Eucalyptus globulus]|uniref:Uncharacterized protein n=1 Tax=Eucalyptus globulus TaxID=34317 RepID=A0ABD3KA98_EUCGL
MSKEVGFSAVISSLRIPHLLAHVTIVLAEVILEPSLGEGEGVEMALGLDLLWKGEGGAMEVEAVRAAQNRAMNKVRVMTEVVAHVAHVMHQQNILHQEKQVASVLILDVQVPRSAPGIMFELIFYAAEVKAEDDQTAAGAGDEAGLFPYEVRDQSMMRIVWMLQLSWQFQA